MTNLIGIQARVLKYLLEFLISCQLLKGTFRDHVITNLKLPIWKVYHPWLSYTYMYLLEKHH